MSHPIFATLKLFLSLILVLSFHNARASALLLDFGATPVASADATLSMGHFAGAVSAADTSWNPMGNADNSSLIYADGTAASGVSVVVGRSDVGVSNIVDFGNKKISSSALGGQENIGIYTNTSPVRDGIFATGTATVNTNVLGIRIDGLAAGTYTLYISGRNTSTAVNAAQQFFATNGAISATFPFITNSTPSVVEMNSASMPGVANPTEAAAITSAFTYGDNCVCLVAALNPGDSLYLAAAGIAANEYRGFLNAVEVVPGQPVLTNFPATIGKQPTAAVTAYEGSTVTIGNVGFGGFPPLYYQWYYGVTPISGATNSALTLSNVSSNNTGNYYVVVSNQVASQASSNVVVTVIPLFNTAQMTNIWNLLPGDRFYITATNVNNERGLAYDPVTGDLLLVAQSPTNNLVVINSTNGAEKYFMNLGGVTGTGAGAVNMIGVADDGAVYAANVVANAGGTSYVINRWNDDNPNTISSIMFSGDPGFSGPAGLRWGDNIAVRGAGLDTQILTAPGNSTNIICLFTMDPSGAYVLPNLITITNVPPTNALAQFGIGFGPGTNTFWAKTLKQQLYLIQFDLASGIGGVCYSASTNAIPSGFRFISTDRKQKWMAGVMTVNSSLPDNVRLYNISDYTNNPVLADQELYATANNSGFLYGAGTGSTAFGDNYLFALDSNNGIKAFQINTNLLPFKIISVVPQSGAKVVLTWESVPNHAYQIQSRTNLEIGSWSDLGSPISAAGTATSSTNPISAPAQYLRVQGQ
jgi:hypothetical protein